MDHKFSKVLEGDFMANSGIVPLRRPLTPAQSTGFDLQQGLPTGPHSGTTVTVVYDAQLQSRIEALEKEVQDVKQALLQQSQAGKFPGHVIELKDISYEEAKHEIAEYFEAHHGQNIDPADLQEALGIEIEIAIQACEELEKEGKIKVL